MTLRSASVVPLALAAAGAIAFAAISAQPRAQAGDRLIGPTQPGARVSALLVLRLREHPLERYLDGLVDPASPLYQHYGSAADFGRRFGLPRRELARLGRALRRSGLRIVRRYPQRTALGVAGTARALSRSFGVELDDYATPAGERYHRPRRTAAPAASFRRWVTAVAGLSTRPRAEPADVPSIAPGGLAALAPGDAARAYDTAPFARAGLDGAGQTIAILSFDRFVDGDVAEFDRRFGRSGPAPRHVDVDGGTEVGPGHDEANLDVQIVRGVAPGAQILEYEAPNSTNWADMFNAVFAGPATIVSNSWTICETYLAQSDAADRVAAEHALQVAAFKGVTVFSATGDAGAYDCQRADFAQRLLTVGYPPDSPWNVAVGGTILSVRKNGTYLEETAWQDPLSNAGGGGGVNTMSPRPSWQRGPNVHLVSDHRGIPDVSAAAGMNSPWAVFLDGDLSGISGTSAATPFWAASMLLVQQYLLRRHLGPLCFAAPMLYRVAATGKRFDAFHDVRVGGNRFYPARAGWDYATGLGSPDVWNLARAAADDRRRHPLPAGADGCRVAAG